MDLGLFVPQADLCSAAKTAPLALFDHLVGDGEQCRRNFEPERLGGLEIEHELEFGRLHDRQFGSAFRL